MTAHNRAQPPPSDPALIAESVAHECHPFSDRWRYVCPVCHVIWAWDCDLEDWVRSTLNDGRAVERDDFAGGAVG